MADVPPVRVEESLRIKIGEAKNLAAGGVAKDTVCKVKFDQEDIFCTEIVEKSQNPFYGEEFHCEIPRQFRFLSFYVCEKNSKQEKVLGKVGLKKEELQKYHGKDHWFPLQQVHASSEVQGKAHIEISFDSSCDNKHRLAVRLLECRDLTPTTNGACSPFAILALSRPRHVSKKEEIKRTVVKKKTVSPKFDEIFYFDLEKKGQNHDRNILTQAQLGNLELSVSLWHDDSRVSREVFGHMFTKVFLGEIRIPLGDLQPSQVHEAWYFLQPRAHKHGEISLGTLRVKISYTSDMVFSSGYYDNLRQLILKSPSIKPVTSSAAYLLGEICDAKEEASQPLVRIFQQHCRSVQLIRALADHEISKTTDPNTIFRGNTLASKCIDDLMKLVGHHYLQDTLQEVVNEIFAQKKPCEIDPTKLKDGENVTTNMQNLEYYVKRIFEAIVYSGLACPLTMCEVFYALKEAALKYFPENREVRYQVVSGFVFLRFFAPAILGPRLFKLRSDMPDTHTHRTLTLISKTIQSLGNIVSTKTHAFGFKEAYMIPLFRKFTDSKHIEAIKSFLDIISSLTRMHSTSIEAPVVLKEGYLIKRAQGRTKFGLKNFKHRYFCLTNHSLLYAKGKGSPPRCEIPIEDILAVETLQENSFTRKYMFQVIQPQRVLYIQASNCVDEKEWKHILNKVCNMNRNRRKTYHPGAYLHGHWLCCKDTDMGLEGCTPVSGRLPADIHIDMDTDREVERIHSHFFNNIDKLQRMQEDNDRLLKYVEACQGEVVYSGERTVIPVYHVEDTRSCCETIQSIFGCVSALEQQHKQYLRVLEKQTVLGSQEFPYGDDGYSIR